MTKITFDNSVEKFFSKLINGTPEDKNSYAEISKTIFLLKELGPKIKMPHSQNIKGYKGLKELRILKSNKNYRILYCIKNNEIIILLHVVEKKN